MESRPGELVFDVLQDEDGGFVAESIGENIVTEADSWQELRTNVREAVAAYFFGSPVPASVRLHLVRDEVFSVIVTLLTRKQGSPPNAGENCHDSA